MKRLRVAMVWLLGLALVALIDLGWSAYLQNPALQLWLLGAPWCG